MLKLLINIVTVALLFSTVICGLYLHFAKDKISDYSSGVNFHLNIAILTVIVVLVNIFVIKQR